MAGYCAVDPINENGKFACGYCDFTALCRVKEAGLKAQDEGGAENGE
jgi:ATP-dependent helicase/DNAse subunit B